MLLDALQVLLMDGCCLLSWAVLDSAIVIRSIRPMHTNAVQPPCGTLCQTSSSIVYQGLLVHVLLRPSGHVAAILPGVGEDLNGQEMCPRVSIPHAHPTNPTLITGMPSPLALVSVLCVHFLGKGLKKVRTWGCGAWTPGMFQFCIPSNL